MISLPIAINCYEIEKGRIEIIEGAKFAASILIPLGCIVFFIFFCTIKREYRGTFLSRQRGKDLTVSKFVDSKDDGLKATAAFCNSRYHWKSIEGEVREWVEKNWDRWEEEKPKWLDEDMKARIPVEFIPTAMERNREIERRRPSVRMKGGMKVNPEKFDNEDNLDDDHEKE